MPPATGVPPAAGNASAQPTAGGTAHPGFEAAATSTGPAGSGSEAAGTAIGTAGSGSEAAGTSTGTTGPAWKPPGQQSAPPGRQTAAPGRRLRNPSENRAAPPPAIHDPFADPAPAPPDALPPGIPDGTLYAVVYSAGTGSAEPGRRPAAYGLAEDELRRQQPQIFDLLATEFSALHVGCARDGRFRAGIRPAPPGCTPP